MCYLFRYLKWWNGWIEKGNGVDIHIYWGYSSVPKGKRVWWEYIDKGRLQENLRSYIAKKVLCYLDRWSMEWNFIRFRLSASSLIPIVFLRNHISPLKYSDHLSSKASLTNKPRRPWSSLRHWYNNSYTFTLESFIRKNWINYWQTSTHP